MTDRRLPRPAACAMPAAPDTSASFAPSAIAAMPDPARRRLLAAAACSPLAAFAAPALAAAAGASAAPAGGPPLRLTLIEGLSGPFANAGAAVQRNLQWAVERVNARGGVALAGGRRLLVLESLDSQGRVDQALSLLRGALDRGSAFVCQGNSSAVAAALVDALDKHNAREPSRRAIFLNYAAVDPDLTGAHCSFWHFRFDAHADMRLRALVDVMRDDRALKSVYLIDQDYSFGQYVLRRSREMIAAARPDVRIAGTALHPMGTVKDFLPYAERIRASGAQAVVTGNWGNDLTLLVKAVKDAGVSATFYTFYGNALGVPAALGESGVGSVLAVAEWCPNRGDAATDALVAAFRRRFPDPAQDYLHLRMQVMVEMLALAAERAGTADATAVARALEGLHYDGATLGGVTTATLRAEDHQLQQPLVVSVMDRLGAHGVRHDVEGSGYGFRPVKAFTAAQAAMPSAGCRMRRPA